MHQTPVNVEAVTRSAIDLLVKPQLSSLYGDEARKAGHALDRVVAGSSATEDALDTASGTAPISDSLPTEG